MVLKEFTKMDKTENTRITLKLKCEGKIHVGQPRIRCFSEVLNMLRGDEMTDREFDRRDCGKGNFRPPICIKWKGC
jgi:hypothetical protein